MEETKKDCPWITRDIINYAFKKYLKKKATAKISGKQEGLIALNMEESVVDGSLLAREKAVDQQEQLTLTK